MTDRQTLLDAWAKWWRQAQELGLQVEPLRFNAPDSEILRRGKALRQAVLEARENGQR